MASYFPPTEDLPIFDSAVFEAANSVGISAAEAAALYLKRTGVATSIATSTSFSNEVAAPSFTSLSSGAAALHLDNLPGNNASLVIRNQRTDKDTIYRQYGTTNSHIFTTDTAAVTNLTLSSTANTFGTIGITNQGNLTLSSANPIINSSNAATDLTIRSGAGRGINIQTDNGTTTVLALASAGQITIPSTIRTPGSGSTGLTLANQASNTGGVLLVNQDTSSDMVLSFFKASKPEKIAFGACSIILLIKSLILLFSKKS
jgi:hypothetical protein